MHGGISHDGKQNYICHECGATWSGKGKWLLFPVKLRLSRHFSFGVHGVETEPNGTERRVFKTILSLGFIRIILGDGYESKVEWSVKLQLWIPKRKGFTLVEKQIDDYLEKIAG